ncbi:uncharacterized protein (DUF736 family) [Labrenzia sp. EL_208]|uniref:DUF736 domain-containing protein n=1 Tax=Labrenzia sp. DG1229 TaxID=681847 RepID=UPI00048F51B0|nr:DUF736 domain-containing protein [Labrenzia sp. DG1229]MBG6173622.1 uncharacterized protein (DUF736 family) [Labrenzia sp. EL_132]MBG6211019.1 uncharacterized protein (DUF736 family) [Labrenzia sp. EL_126]MBG6227608.1 uncharacterized protein (DUF736 family) [Labrenzia sp. EL_208]
MATIGSFTTTKDGYTGTIRTLTINVKVNIVANDKKGSEGAPDFRVYGGRAELGAAWKSKTNDHQSREYLSVLLDDPSFSNPIRAALFEEEGTAFLVWNRREG